MKKNKLIIVCLLVFCLLSCRWTPGNNTKEKEGAEHEEFGLSNDEICIKQDLMRGGAISFSVHRRCCIYFLLIHSDIFFMRPKIGVC